MLSFAIPVASLWGGLWARLESHWQSFSRVFVGEDLLIQLAGILGALLLAYLLMLGLRPLFKRLGEMTDDAAGWIDAGVDWICANLLRILVALLLWSVSISFDSYHERLRSGDLGQSAERVAVVAAEDGKVALQQSPDSEARALGQPVDKNYILVRAIASLATLWLVSGALPRSIKKKAYFRALFFILAIVLMLNLLGLRATISSALDSLKILPFTESGDTQVTVLTLIKGIIAILIIIPLTAWLMRVTETRVDMMRNVSPALQVLAIKILKVLIVVVAALLAISSIGINLSTFAIFGGAIGLGLGFGLQKVISNLVSGVILLGDSSIKPGDVIEVDQTYGWINKLGARYASVITRDGTEHLIPNEMLITEKVINWSFSNENVRLKIPFGVSYHSDIHKVMELAMQAAQGNARVLAQPPPVVRLMGFGDNSVDFELRIWIRDPSSGVNNVRSDIYVALWDLFQEHKIEIPFPQRDLHLVDSVPLEVKVQQSKNGPLV